APCNTPTQVREALVFLAHAEHWPKNTVADA
ncbi:heme iron utilization protein, partial [Pseudomonas neuropathica]